MSDFEQVAAPEYPVFLGSEFSHPSANDAFFHVLPVPFEATVDYGAGTANGPKAILEASWQIEKWDGKGIPGEKGIHTLPPVDVDADGNQVIENIANATKKIAENEKFPVVFGGEHTVTYGVVKGLIDAGIEDFGVVQIDAHADLRDSYKGETLSHATAMKRILDEDIPVFQIGTRSACEEEMNTRKVYGVKHIDAEVLVPKNIQKIELPDDFPEKIFLSIDVQGFDTSVFPTTSTPIPGGLGWYQTLSLLESIAEQRDIIGFDIMEFRPVEGLQAYNLSAALLAYKMMGIVERSIDL